MAKMIIGNIYEINTEKGKAYLHYIFKDDELGELVRVLPGLYSEKPTNFNELVESEELFSVFFPLSFANKKKIVEFVGNYSDKKFTKPNYMRSEHIVKGEFLGWHIVNTDTWERQLVKKLSQEQKTLSPWGIWNDTLLVERLVGNWKLSEWCNSQT